MISSRNERIDLENKDFLVIEVMDSVTFNKGDRIRQMLNQKEQDSENLSDCKYLCKHSGDSLIIGPTHEHGARFIFATQIRSVV